MSIGDEDGRRSTVLLYDDSYMICKTIESSLQQWNIEVEVVRSAQVLFEKLENDVADHPEDEKIEKTGASSRKGRQSLRENFLAFAQKHKLVSEDGLNFLGAVKAKRKTRSGSVARGTSGGSAEKKSKEHAPVEVHKILPAMLLLTWPAAAKSSAVVSPNASAFTREERRG